MFPNLSLLGHSVHNISLSRTQWLYIIKDWQLFLDIGIPNKCHNFILHSLRFSDKQRFLHFQKNKNRDNGLFWRPPKQNFWGAISRLPRSAKVLNLVLTGISFWSSGISIIACKGCRSENTRSNFIRQEVKSRKFVDPNVAKIFMQVREFWGIHTGLVVNRVWYVLAICWL